MADTRYEVNAVAAQTWCNSFEGDRTDAHSSQSTVFESVSGRDGRLVFGCYVAWSRRRGGRRTGPEKRGGDVREGTRQW